MTQPDVSIGLEAKGEVAVEYGERRKLIAAMYQIDPARVTAAHVAEYEEMEQL